MMKRSFPNGSVGLSVTNIDGPVMPGKAIPAIFVDPSVKIIALPLSGMLLIVTGNCAIDNGFEFLPNQDDKIPAASNTVLLGVPIKTIGRVNPRESFLLAKGLGKFSSSFGRSKGRLVIFMVLAPLIVAHNFELLGSSQVNA